MINSNIEIRNPIPDRFYCGPTKRNGVINARPDR